MNNTQTAAFDFLQDYAGNEKNVNWEQWRELDLQIYDWKQQSAGRRIVVTIGTDVSTEHAAFKSLKFADKVVIALETYTDGRVFGLARVLRNNIGYVGELQVSGDYLPDQIRYFQRCGIDSFAESKSELVDSYYDRVYQPTTVLAQNEIDIRSCRRSQS